MSTSSSIHARNKFLQNKKASFAASPAPKASLPKLTKGTGGQNRARSTSNSMASLPPLASERKQQLEIESLASAGYYCYKMLDKSSRGKIESLNMLKHVLHSFETLHRLQGDSLEVTERPDPVCFVPKPGRQVLVLDLDETLVHCCNFDPQVQQQAAQVTLQYLNDKGQTVNARMTIRPHVDYFLESVSRHFDVVVYTASDREYATAVVGYLDPDRRIIKDILHRRHCVKTKKGFTVKDLKYLMPGGDMSRVFLVDNSTHCFAPQIHNGIPIIPFYYDTTDDQLPKLSEFLVRLKDYEQPTTLLRTYFSLHQYTKFGTVQRLLAFLSELHPNK